jgi:hypothetical protein
VPLEIDSKDLEDLVLREEDYVKQYSISKRIFNAKRYTPELSTLDVHPWRTKREFVKIYERASPKNKYSTVMPKNLENMRGSLDMTQKKKKKINYSVTADLILPQLKAYEI